MEKKDQLYIVNSVFSHKASDLLKGQIETLEPNIFRYFFKGKNYIVQLFEEEDKIYTLKIDGQTLKVEAKDDLDLLIEQLGFNAMSAMKLSSIKAPMPGLVLDVMVSVGDAIAKGDSLLILEAMKMENVIKSEGEGVIKSIEINQGDKVDKGQILIELE